MSDVEQERSRKVALNLMRMALALLDRADESIAAARLQHAIDTAQHAPADQVDHDAPLAPLYRGHSQRSG